MQQYTRRDETPLKFHNFFRYITLPLGFFITLATIIDDYTSPASFNWLYMINLVFFISSLMLRLVCFIGFLKWKPYAWYSLMVYLCLDAFYRLYELILSYSYRYQVSTALGNLLGTLLYAILVGLYYKKRKSLFFTSGLQDDVQDDMQEDDTSTP